MRTASPHPLSPSRTPSTARSPTPLHSPAGCAELQAELRAPQPPWPPWPPWPPRASRCAPSTGRQHHWGGLKLTTRRYRAVESSLISPQCSTDSGTQCVQALRLPLEHMSRGKIIVNRCSRCLRKRYCIEVENGAVLRRKIIMVVIFGELRARFGHRIGILFCPGWGWVVGPGYATVGLSYWC